MPADGGLPEPCGRRLPRQRRGHRSSAYKSETPVRGLPAWDRTINRSSMCPAFGSLRVGAHASDATVLSGSACCLWAVLHLALLRRRRTVGYVPFNSETSGHRQALRGHSRRGVRPRRPGEIRRLRGDPTVRPHGVRRPADCCRKSRTAFASSASTAWFRRADARRSRRTGGRDARAMRAKD